MRGCSDQTFPKNSAAAGRAERTARARTTQQTGLIQDDRTIHTNTIEGYFSIFKRGMKGVYQHASKKHLHRYLAEFDFRSRPMKLNPLALGFYSVPEAARLIEVGSTQRIYGWLRGYPNRHSGALIKREFRSVDGREEIASLI